MADDKNKVADKAGEIAKNIWLAGVGAYGRAVDEAQGRLEKAGVEPPKLFRELVKAGAALEDEARDAIEAGTAARSSMEERINRVRDNFNLQRPARGEDLVALHEKIDRLAAKVDALTDALSASVANPSTGKAPRNTPAKKSARKKPPANTQAPAANKKAPAANKKAPAAKPKVTAAKRKAPKAKQKAPAAKRKAPARKTPSVSSSKTSR